ncbi:RecA-family ATPase [Bradyrhizobium elkanii]|nr:RecA-family ATPase [Bradyrhizobium elkanii]
MEYLTNSQEDDDADEFSAVIIGETKPDLPRELITGFLCLGETSALVAPPKSGKSKLVLDMALHIEHAREWRGKSVPRPYGVLIFPRERRSQYHEDAYYQRIRDRLGGARKTFMSANFLNLKTNSGVRGVVKLVRSLEREHDCKIGLIVIDTLPMAIAESGLDENSAKDVNAVAARLQIIHDRLDVHIMLVAHTGKAGGRGPRGSSALVGHVDMVAEIAMDKTSIRTLSVTDANHLVPGEVTRFQIKGWCRPGCGWNAEWRNLRHREAIRLRGEVNWLIDGFCGERFPAIDLAHVDLTGSEQSPEQHGRGVR